jgi:pyruvate dehydrogenase E2 component (dihydrolipoamide acetyltransferase)
MSSFRLPDLGEGLKEAEIVAWHASVGDHVVAEQPLVSVETEKAIVDIPSPESGRIAVRFGEPGDVIQVGDPLVEFEDAEHADTGTVVGRIADVESGRAPRAAPAVRALAQELGVDLSTLTASGPDGSITSVDVRRGAIEESTATVDEDWQALRGMRRTMARNMADAHALVVPATLNDDAVIDHWPEHCDPTVRLARALGKACSGVPALNAWYDGERKARRLNQRVSIGIAVETEDGLLVPVIPDPTNLGDAEIQIAIERVKTDARERKLTPEQLRGQTITLSNFGMLGGRYASLVIMPPQVAILGAGHLHDAVLVSDGAPVVRRVLPLSLTFDHRAVTGAEAARFLGAVIHDLEN